MKFLYLDKIKRNKILKKKKVILDLIVKRKNYIQPKYLNFLNVSSCLKKYCSFNYQLIRFFMFDGLKLFATKHLHQSYFSFFFFLRNYKWYIDQKFNIQSFFNFLALVNLNKNFYNINFLFEWCLSFLSQIFNIKCIRVPKKFKKKFKKKFVFKLNQLAINKRNNVFFKLFSLSTFSLKYRYVNDRVFSALLTLVCGYKKSYLYKRKLYIYKWILKNKLLAGAF